MTDMSDTGSLLCGAALVMGAAVAIVTVDKLGRKLLLLWSCTGITCCLAVLGAYCDPHLHPWYHHHLWPYRTMKENTNIQESVGNITDMVNLTNDLGNLSRQNDLLVNFSRDESVMNFSEVDNVTQWKNVEYKDGMVTPIVLLSLTLFMYNIGLGSVPYVLVSELFALNVRSLASSLLIAWQWLSSFLLLRYYSSIAMSLGLHSTYYLSATFTLLGAGYIYLTIPETKGRTQEQIDTILDGPLLVVCRS